MLNSFRATVTHAFLARSPSTRNLDREFDSTFALELKKRTFAQAWRRIRERCSSVHLAYFPYDAAELVRSLLGRSDSSRLEDDRTKGFGSGRPLFRASFDATVNRPRISRLALSGITIIYSLDCSTSDSPARGEYVERKGQ